MSRPTRKQILKVLFAVLSAVAVIATVSPALTGLVANMTLNRQRDAAAVTSTTTTAPVVTIKPLPVRPVLSAFVTTPEQCPPPAPVPPDQPMRGCDIPRTAVYELSPEAMEVELLNVDSLRNPLTGVEMVQMTMTPDSAKKFGEFTAGQVGKQVAFVRDGTVVWSPKITTPIDGQVLQLSGELTAEQAARVAAMLRNDN